MSARLDDKDVEIKRLTKNHYTLTDQFIGVNQEITRRVKEIVGLRSKNEHMKNEVKNKKETNERLKIFEESIRKLDE